MPPDWSHLHSFALVARHGSLSAAARASGQSQPTLSRHVAALEAEFGQRLFTRQPRGLSLTEFATGLLPEIEAMAEAAGRLSLGSASASAPGGTVRLTASCYVATYLLPPILTRLRRSDPQIEIELVASDATENLLRREADIALRMFRPTQNDVIARKLGDLPLGLYATPDYLARRGTPRTMDALRDHDLIGYDRSDLILRGFAAAGMTVARDFFAFRSDDQVLCWEMVKAGFGLGFGQRIVGDAEPGLTRVDLGDIGALPVWLVAHRELGATARIRRVYDALADGLAALTI